LLTQRTRQLLWRLRRQTRYVEAERPGELLCLDTFYISTLKDVGKVWQVTPRELVSRRPDPATAAAVATDDVLNGADAKSRKTASKHRGKGLNGRRERPSFRRWSFDLFDAWRA